MKNILVASAICFILTHAASGQITLDVKPLPKWTPTPVVTSTPTPLATISETPTPAPTAEASPSESATPPATPQPTAEQYSDSKDPDQKIAETPAQREKPLAFSEFKARAKAMKVNDELIFSYDRFKDAGVVVTKPQNIVSGGASFAVALADAMATGPYGTGRTSGLPTSLTYTIVSLLKGDSMSETPQYFALIFESNSRGWVFLKGDQNLYLIIGGERVVLHPLAEDRDIYGGYHVSVGEQLVFRISRPVLERIAAGGKNVEIRLGDTLPRHFQSGWTKRIQAFLDFTKLEAAK